MEIKAELNKPYTEEERIVFIINNNQRNGYEIIETETSLQAWGYTEEEIKKQEREMLDSLILTPSDVERALYKAKKINFAMLKEVIQQAMPTIDMIALDIEFRAKDFWRGATFGEVKLFDVVGQLLGYTPEDMDYLFLNKSLPEKDEEDTQYTNL